MHPQPETYWGHVNPIGPRACYDEGKRVAETMCYAYQKQVPIKLFTPCLFLEKYCFLDFNLKLVFQIKRFWNDLFIYIFRKRLKFV